MKTVIRVYRVALYAGLRKFLPWLQVFSFALPFWEYHSHMPQHRWMNLSIVALEEKNAKLYQIPVAEIPSLFIFLLCEVCQCRFFSLCLFFFFTVQLEDIYIFQAFVKKRGSFKHLILTQDCSITMLYKLGAFQFNCEH